MRGEYKSWNCWGNHRALIIGKVFFGEIFEAISNPISMSATAGRILHLHRISNVELLANYYLHFHDWIHISLLLPAVVEYAFWPTCKFVRLCGHQI